MSVATGGNKERIQRAGFLIEGIWEAIAELPHYVADVKKCDESPPPPEQRFPRRKDHVRELTQAILQCVCAAYFARNAIEPLQDLLIGARFELKRFKRDEHITAEVAGIRANSLHEAVLRAAEVSLTDLLGVIARESGNDLLMSHEFIIRIIEEPDIEYEVAIEETVEEAVDKLVIAAWPAICHWVEGHCEQTPPAWYTSDLQFEMQLEAAQADKAAEPVKREAAKASAQSEPIPLEHQSSPMSLADGARRFWPEEFAKRHTKSASSSGARKVKKHMGLGTFRFIKVENEYIFDKRQFQV